MLNTLQEKDDGIVTRMAAGLTPFVKALYNGEGYDVDKMIQSVDVVLMGSEGIPRIVEHCAQR